MRLCFVPRCGISIRNIVTVLLTLTLLVTARPVSVSVSSGVTSAVNYNYNSLGHREGSSVVNIHSPLGEKAISNASPRNARTMRGGSSPNSNPSKQRELSGVLVFILLDKLFRSLFTANKIAFPSQLGGCIILFVTLFLSEFVKPGAGELVFQTLAPGAALLAKWLPVFFVPGLAMLPLAPSMGSSFEVLSFFVMYTQRSFRLVDHKCYPF